MAIGRTLAMSLAIALQSSPTLMTAVNRNPDWRDKATARFTNGGALSRAGCRPKRDACHGAPGGPARPLEGEGEDLERLARWQVRERQRVRIRRSSRPGQCPREAVLEPASTCFFVAHAGAEWRVSGRSRIAR